MTRTWSRPTDGAERTAASLPLHRLMCRVRGWEGGGAEDRWGGGGGCKTKRINGSPLEPFPYAQTSEPLAYSQTKHKLAHCWSTFSLEWIAFLCSISTPLDITALLIHSGGHHLLLLLLLRCSDNRYAPSPLKTH